MADEHNLNGQSNWPLASLLLVGTFGKNSLGGQRYHTRCKVAFGLGLTAFITAIFTLPHFAGLMERAYEFTAVYYAIAGLTLTYISWAFWQYLSDLDELSRRIQLEAIALTYLTGLGAFSFLSAFTFATQWTLNPLWFIFLEPVRGFWLWRLARRY